MVKNRRCWDLRFCNHAPSPRHSFLLSAPTDPRHSKVKCVPAIMENEGLRRVPQWLSQSLKAIGLPKGLVLPPTITRKSSASQPSPRLQIVFFYSNRRFLRALHETVSELFGVLLGSSALWRRSWNIDLRCMGWAVGTGEDRHRAGCRRPPSGLPALAGAV